ncbi:MAG: spermidine/putrescine ABC transporter substrate-binding protein [Clostridia bacterium]|nr:spermidine/putrescine ABC transporter substrate-binding protein [Clostridia bacterium]
MKRILSFSLICINLLFAFSMAISPVSAAEQVTLNIYNWGEYISDGSDDTVDVNKAFEEKYPHIKINYINYASNEDLYGKLKAGGSSYDVIFPSDYMISRMIEENMLEKIDVSKLENYKYIDDRYKNLEYDPNNEYSVPYSVGMVGVIYDSTKVVSEDTGSWNLLWNEKYKGQILNFNNSRDAFATAQFLLGKSVNSDDKADWLEALEKLKEQKPLLQGYVMDEVFLKMQGGNAAVATYYAGDFLTMYSENDDLAFYYPKEGTNFFVDAMCIPKGSKNIEEAMLYIDFLLSEEIAVANAEYICYASPNTLVPQNEEYIEYIQEMHPDALEILYPQATAFRTESYLNLSEEMRRYESQLWEELMSYGSQDAGIYILSIVLAVGILALWITTSIRKRRLSKY